MSNIKETMKGFLLDADVQLAMDWGKERNIFDIVGMGETRHSKMIAWLCDPREGHLQKDYFLKSLLRAALANQADVGNLFFEHWDAADIECYSFGHALGMTELQLQDSKDRIDVAIIDPVNEIAVFIENKTGSKESADQTKKYFASLSEQYKNYSTLFIFMDMKEGEAKDEGNWVNLDYDWLCDAINPLFSRHILDAETEIILKQYVESLEENYEENSYFKKPFARFSKIAQKYRLFLSEVKKQALNVSIDKLSSFEDGKLRWIYKQHEAFFVEIFEFSGFEHTVEQLGKDLGYLIEMDFKKSSYYIHADRWSESYEKDSDECYWGVQFKVLVPTKGEEHEESTTSYAIEIKIHPASFENPEKASELALVKQKKLGRRATQWIVIHVSQEIDEENLLKAMKVAVKDVENYLEEYNKTA